MIILTVICLIALNLLMWCRTDVWIEYTKLLHLDCISFYKDYEKKLENDALLTYHIYLRRYHNSFWTRLITCPTCLAVWQGIFFGITTSISMIPIYIIGGLLLFAVIDKLLG